MVLVMELSGQGWARASETERACAGARAAATAEEGQRRSLKHGTQRERVGGSAERSTGRGEAHKRFRCRMQASEQRIKLSYSQRLTCCQANATVAGLRRRVCDVDDERERQYLRRNRLRRRRLRHRHVLPQCSSRHLLQQQKHQRGHAMPSAQSSAAMQRARVFSWSVCRTRRSIGHSLQIGGAHRGLRKQSCV